MPTHYVEHIVDPGKGSMKAPTICLLHWLTETEDPSFMDEGAFERKVAVLKANNVLYNMMRWSGESRLLVPAGRKVYHAGGSPGLAGDDNAVSFGVAVPYISPSFQPRGVEGEVELPFVPRDSAGKLLPERTAWYPPIRREDLVGLVLAAREVFLEQGWARGAVLTHAQVNPGKNDIRNIDVNCGTSIAELHTIFVS